MNADGERSCGAFALSTFVGFHEITAYSLCYWTLKYNLKKLFDVNHKKGFRTQTWKLQVSPNEWDIKSRVEASCVRFDVISMNMFR